MQPLIALMKLVTRPCQIEVTPSVRKVRRGLLELESAYLRGKIGTMNSYEAQCDIVFFGSARGKG